MNVIFPLALVMAFASLSMADKRAATLLPPQEAACKKCRTENAANCEDLNMSEGECADRGDHFCQSLCSGGIDRTKKCNDCVRFVEEEYCKESAEGEGKCRGQIGEHIARFCRIDCGLRQKRQSTLPSCKTCRRNAIKSCRSLGGSKCWRQGSQVCISGKTCRRGRASGGKKGKRVRGWFCWQKSISRCKGLNGAALAACKDNYRNLCGYQRSDCQKCIKAAYGACKAAGKGLKACGGETKEACKDKCHAVRRTRATKEKKKKVESDVCERVCRMVQIKHCSGGKCRGDMRKFCHHICKPKEN